ncbi:anthrone oxygenase family protein [Kitasatospora sp. NPDC093806]|uniref:anthrone oxygenase family protein n=1 Tax=Kitasatospora sp. NPDC093806 TaxID=3155075 RepID=UPI003443E8F1
MDGMEAMRVFALVAATITTGLSAGLFYAYACSVMPGLRTTDDLTFIQVMQRINVAILNGWFLLGFVGALVFTLAAVALHLPDDGHRVLPAAVGALVCYTGSLVVTRVVNIPLNEALAAAGEPGRIADPVRVRGRFEARWVRWNTARALLSTAALGFLCWALVLHCHVAPN